MVLTCSIDWTLNKLISLSLAFCCFIISNLQAQLWVEVNKELGAVTDITEIDGILHTISNTGVSAFSSDMGMTWQIQNISDAVALENGILTCIGFFGEEEGLIGVRNVNLGNEILRTTDSGSTWKAEVFNLIDTCSTGFIPIGLNIVDDSTAVVLGFRNNNYRITTNRGQSWGCSRNFTTPQSLQSLYVTDDGSWIINDLNGIYTSIDRGETWMNVIDKRFIHHQLMEDSIHVALSTTFDEADGIPRLVLSNRDFSSSETIPLIDFKGVYIEHFVSISADELFLQVNGTEIYYSADGGQSFKFIQELSNQPLRSVQIEDDWYLAGRGLWKLDKNLSSTVAVSEKAIIKIYPNPGIDFINIKDKSFSSFQIFNLQGQLISNGAILEEKINISDLKQGTYILKVSSNDRHSVQKFAKL